MKIIICGGGVVGSTIARYLVSGNNEVTVIDQDASYVKELEKGIDIKTISGNGARPDVLESARAGEVDMLIAVTQSDEVNMVACQAASFFFNVPTRIARIRDQRYLDGQWGRFFGREAIPIDVTISPEREVAQSIGHHLEVPGSFESLFLAEDRIGVIALRCHEGDEMEGSTVSELPASLANADAEVVGLRREGSFIEISDENKVAAKDILYFLTRKEGIGPLMVSLGRPLRDVRQIIQLGAGNIGIALAQIIAQRFADVRLKIIERNPERAARAYDLCKGQLNANQFSIIKGDGLDPQILAEASVKTCETFLAVTDEDESNILASLLAKHYGCQRTVALVNKPDYDEFITDLGIDAVIDPRTLTIATILRHVRRGRVLSVHPVADGSGEILEFEILKTSSLVGTALSKVDLPHGARFGAVLRGREDIILASKDPTVREHDRIILFAPGRVVGEVEKIFAARLEFF